MSNANDVFCFGSNQWGQLGLASGASEGPQPVPVRVENLRAKSVMLAGTFTLAVTTNDRLWSWGSNDFLQLARAALDPDAGTSRPPALADRVSSAVHSTAGTNKNAFAVTDAGEVLSWGAGTAEQLGRTTSTPIDAVPKSIGIGNVSSVVAGTAHACVLARGAIRCWGRNDRGQLGTGVRADELFPASVVLPGDVHAVAVAAGGNDTCAIASNGDVYCWGENGSGQVGIAGGLDQLLPRRIEGLAERTVAIAVMDRAVCALSREGRVACWGDNLMGQLGRGSRDVDLHVDAAPVVFESSAH
ncbi:BNR repeat domain protein [Labilithrix luteola]|uniref:BNR repeat domain protein n=1 Tax=Labilithrix luteola TaxID=1391654 RepID=A0A0K1QFI0_9BACT|nr:BNR repeat domain protein [Labilithrix luteola]